MLSLSRFVCLVWGLVSGKKCTSLCTCQMSVQSPCAACCGLSCTTSQLGWLGLPCLWKGQAGSDGVGMRCPPRAHLIHLQREDTHTFSAWTRWVFQRCATSGRCKKKKPSSIWVVTKFQQVPLSVNNVLLTGPQHPPTPQDQSPMWFWPCFAAHTMKTGRVSTMRWCESVNVCAFSSSLQDPNTLSLPPSLPPSGSVTNAILALFWSTSLRIRHVLAPVRTPTPSHCLPPSLPPSLPQDQSPMQFQPCFEAPPSGSFKFLLLSGPQHPPTASLPPSGSVTNAILALFWIPSLTLSLPPSLPPSGSVTNDICCVDSHPFPPNVKFLPVLSPVPTEKQAGKSVESAIEMPQVWNYFFHFATGIPGSTEDIVIKRVADYQNTVLTKHRNGQEWRIWLGNNCKSIELNQERRSQYLKTIKIFIEVSERTGQISVNSWSFATVAENGLQKGLGHTHVSWHAQIPRIHWDMSDSVSPFVSSCQKLFQIGLQTPCDRTGQNSVKPLNLLMLTHMCVPTTLLNTILSRCSKVTRIDWDLTEFVKPFVSSCQKRFGVYLDIPCDRTGQNSVETLNLLMPTLMCVPQTLCKTIHNHCCKRSRIDWDLSDSVKPFVSSCQKHLGNWHTIRCCLWCWLWMTVCTMHSLPHLQIVSLEVQIVHKVGNFNDA